MNRTYLFLFLLPSLFCVSQPIPVQFTVHDSFASTGYYFLSNPDRFLLLDRFGEIIYYRSCSTQTPIYNFALQPNGLITYSNLHCYYIMDSTFTTIDSIADAGNYVLDKHDLRLLPNGHFLFMGMETVPVKADKKAEENATDSLARANSKWVTVLELDAAKKLVFEWRAKQSIKREEIDSFFIANNQFLSWTHANAIELDQDGNILISMRNYNEITKINRTTGAVMWRLGGKANQFKYINCPVPFYGQHDIRRLPNGNITLFDNGNHTKPHGARALEFELDEKKKTAELKWSYTFDTAIYSTRSGNVQRLKNSNTLINYGNLGRNTEDHICFVIVNPKGEKVLEARGVNSYRIFNYASLPWQIHRPQITCFDSLGVTYLDAGAGHLSYLWSTGDSTQIIPITSPGNYSVFVPYGKAGGYVNSEKWVVTDAANLCKPLRLNGRK